MRNAACLLLTDHNCSDGATRWHLCQKGIASSLNLLPISSIVDRCRQNGVCYKSFKAHQGMLFMLFMLSVNFMWGTRFPVRGFLSQLHGSLTSNLPLGVVLNVKMRGFPCFSRPSIYIYNIFKKNIYTYIRSIYPFRRDASAQVHGWPSLGSLALQSLFYKALHGVAWLIRFDLFCPVSQGQWLI